jgi:hypothetical protein
MRIYLHPHDREGLPVEVVLSPDEAERWIAQLQSAVRNVREGQGEQLLLLGEPARVVLTVQEGEDRSVDDSVARLFREDAEPPVTNRDYLFAFLPASFPVIMAILSLIVFALWCVMRWL